jgi:hypothetical protein
VTTDESTREEAAPDPDDPDEPDSPTDLTKRSALYVVRKTAREFSKDQCTDLAAELTSRAVIARMPVPVHRSATLLRWASPVFSETSIRSCESSRGAYTPRERLRYLGRYRRLPYRPLNGGLNRCAD